MRQNFLPLLFAAALVPSAAAEEKPNILWITAEDMSPVLGCYGDEYAVTPNIDALAEESVRYTHAFASAPVCSPARSCLITGCYAPSLGTQQMRSAFPIPDEMTGFPSILRKDHGYYTTNNAKTDYNTSNADQIIEASWDESSPEAHWRKRDDDSNPFFSVFNLMTSHQSRSMVWPYEKFKEEVQSQLDEDEIHDPDKAPLPPYYVDTPIVRREWARFYDCVTAMDKEVGAILDQLEEDGLAENTIVFFYSDHGSGMPRHKRALLDSGMHVPLLIRFPGKWQHLAPAEPGETTDRLVSFVDFGPTVLSLAEAEIPEAMQGVPFLGEKAGEEREYVYGHRDRVDEVRDLARSVRDQRWLYIRNYMPHLGYNQPTSWPDQGEIRHEFYRLTDAGEMTSAQWRFAAPTRPPEELYDCEADPLNLDNLAEQKKHQEVLERMRKAHREHIESTNDLGFIPESEAWKQFEGTTGWEAGKDLDLESIFDAAARVGMATEAEIAEHVNDKDPSIRYWSALGLGAQPELSQSALVKLLQQLDRERSNAARTEISTALLRHASMKKGLINLIAELKKDDLTAVLHAARNLEVHWSKSAEAIPEMKALRDRCYEIRPPDTPPTVVTTGEQDLAMFVAMTANAFLDRHGANETPEEAALEEKEEAAVDADESDCAPAEESEKADWNHLFDGETLDDWKAMAEGEVKVEDGEIHILAKGKNLWLLHEQAFENFELQAEVKMPSDPYNSGIGFRCTPAKGKPKGYQCEVAGAITGKIYAIGSGWVWPKGQEEEKRFKEMAGDSFKPDDWNQLRIRCEGDHIRIWVNGTLTADVHDSTFAKGAVALQHHGKGGVHRFRNIRLLDLP